MTVPWTPIGGVNLIADPLNVPDDQNVKTQNLYPSIAGKMEARKGPAFCAISQNASDQSNRIPTNVFFPRFRDGTYVITQFDTVTGLQYVNAGPMDAVDWAIEAVLPVLITGYRPCMVEFGRRLLILAGACDVGGHAVWEVSENAGVLQCIPAEVYFTDGVGNFLAPRVAGNYRGRMVYANFGPGYEDVMVFSDDANRPYKINAGSGAVAVVLNITTAGGRSLKLLQMEGDSIIAMKDMVRQPEGSPADTALVVLGRHFCVPMSGVPLLTDDVPPVGEGYTGTLNPTKINQLCGCVSAETLVRTVHGLMWAGWNDVWVMDAGSEPRAVGSKLRPALQAGAPQGRFSWHASYHHATGSYRLAIQEPEGAFASLATPCADQWWLDVRGGLPPDSGTAKWYGPMKYNIQDTASPSYNTDGQPVDILGVNFTGTFMVRVDNRDTAPERILGVHVINSSALRSGARSSCLIEFDATVGYDLAVPISTGNHTAFADPVYGMWIDQMKGNEIIWEVLSKEYNFGDPMVDKLFQGMEMQVWAGDLLATGLEVIVDGGKVVQEIDIELDQLGFVSGVDALGARLTHQYQSVNFTPDESTRLTGKVFQFRLFNRPGWPVPVDGINTQIYMSGPAPAQIETVNLTPGFYANLTAFLAMLTTVLTPALAASAEIPTAQLAFGWDFNTGLMEGIGYYLVGFILTPVKWIWNFADLGILDPQTARRSRKIAAMLGYDTSGSATGEADRQDAAELVPLLINPACEIASLGLQVYAFTRRPTGAAYEPNIP